MTLHAACAPHQPVRALVQHIIRKVCERLAAPVIGVPVVVHQIEVVIQRRGAVSLLQRLSRAFQGRQIVLAVLMGEEGGILPGQAHEGILRKLECGKNVCIQLAGLLEQRIRLCGVPRIQRLLICRVHLGDLLPGRACGGLRPIQGSVQGCGLLGGHDRVIHRVPQSAEAGREVQGGNGAVIVSHHQQAVHVVVEQEGLPAVGIPIVKLAVVVGLGKAAPQRRHAGRNACDGQGEVIRPGLRRHDDLDAVGENAIDLGDRGLEPIHKGFQLIGGADLIRRALIHGGQLKVDVRDHLSDPFGMDAEDLVVSAGGPVIARVADAPFLRSHGAEDQRFFRLIAAVDQALCNAHHQGDGGVVILKPGKIGIIVGAHQHHALSVPSGDRTDDVVGGAIHPDTAVRIQRHGGLPGFVHGGPEQLGVRAAHGKGRRVGGTADVLRVQRVVTHLGVAAVLHGDHRGGPGQIRFIGGIVDPPVLPLVDVHQHELSGHIQTGQIRLSPSAAVDDGEGLRAVRDEVRLVSAQLRNMGFAGAVLKAELRLGECPGIQRERILRDVLQSDALHFRLEHIAGGKLRVGACCPVAKGFVAADALQLQRQIIGVIHVYRVEVGLCGVSRGLCGVCSGLLAAGSRGYQQKSCQQCTHDSLFHVFSLLCSHRSAEERKKATDAPAPVA